MKIIIDARRDGYTTSQIKTTMTVGELIDFLSEYDISEKIYLSHDNGYTFGGITANNIHEEEVEEEE